MIILGLVSSAILAYGVTNCLISLKNGYFQSEQEQENSVLLDDEESGEEGSDESEELARPDPASDLEGSSDDEGSYDTIPVMPYHYNGNDDLSTDYSDMPELVSTTTEEDDLSRGYEEDDLSEAEFDGFSEEHSYEEPDELDQLILEIESSQENKQSYHPLEYQEIMWKLYHLDQRYQEISQQDGLGEYLGKPSWERRVKQTFSQMVGNPNFRRDPFGFIRSERQKRQDDQYAVVEDTALNLLESYQNQLDEQIAEI